MKKSKFKELCLVLSCCLGVSTAVANPVWEPAPNGNSLQGNTVLTLNEDYALTTYYSGAYSLTVNSAGTNNYTLKASSDGKFRQLFTGGLIINNAKVVMNYNPLNFQSQFLNSILVNQGGMLEFAIGGVMGAPGYDGCLATITLNGGTLVNSAIDTGTKAKHNLLGNVVLSNGGSITVKDGLTSSTTWAGNYGLEGNISVTAGNNMITAEKIVLTSRLNTGTNANTNAFDVAANSSLTVAGYLLNPTSTIDTSARKLVKSGSGTLILNSASNSKSLSNTYSGGTNITSGVLRIDGLQAGTGTIAVSNGATLQINSSVTQTNALSIVGSGATDASGKSLGALYFSKDGAESSGAITLTGAVTIGVAVDTTATISNTVSGNYVLTKTGAGTLVISKDFLYTHIEATNISEGILRVDDSGRLGQGGNLITVASGATFQVNAATLASASDGYKMPTTKISGAGMKDSSGNDLGALNFMQNANFQSGRLSLGAASTIGIVADKSLYLNANITGAYDLTITGGGTLSVQTNQTVSRNTIVDNGTLVLAVASNVDAVNNVKSGLLNGTITANAGGTIEFAVGGVQGYNNSGTTTGGPATIILNGGTLVNSATQVVDGITYAYHNILGPLELSDGGLVTVKDDLKSMPSISESNNWGGNYALDGDIVVKAGLNSNDNVIKADKLVMACRMTSSPKTRLTINIADTANLTIDGNLLNTEYSNDSVGAAARLLVKSGEGTLILKGSNNTYRGSTKVTSGVLRIDTTGNGVAGEQKYASAFEVGTGAESSELYFLSDANQIISVPSVTIGDNGTLTLLVSGAQSSNLNITGDLLLDNFDSLSIELGDLLPVNGMTYDVLNVGGTIKVDGAEITAEDYARFLSPEVNYYFNAIALGDGAIVLQTDSAAVPEPASWMILVLGAGFIGFWRRKKVA